MLTGSMWGRAPRRRGDAGSVLLLMPAAVLVVLVLGAIAVDLAAVHQRQRAAIGAAGSAANDAVTYGLDEDALRRGDGYRLDPSRVERAVTESLEAQGLADDLVDRPVVTVLDANRVRVVVRLRAQHVFAGALPGHARISLVRGTAEATAEPGRADRPWS